MIPSFTFGEVSLEQTAFDRFRVRYGKQVKTLLNYEQAARELGECLMHQLACDSLIDNRTRQEAKADGDTKPVFDHAV